MRKMPPIAPSSDTIIPLKLRAHQINTIIKALSVCPWIDVHQIITDLDDQGAEFLSQENDKKTVGKNKKAGKTDS